MLTGGPLNFLDPPDDDGLLSFNRKKGRFIVRRKRRK